MHLVFVTSLVPDGAPRSGYEIANAAIVDAVRRAGARVTALGFVAPGKRPSDPEHTVVLGEVDVSTDTATAMRKVGWLASAIARGMTVSSVKLAGREPREIEAALHRLGPVDGYILNSVQLAGAYPALFSDRPSLYVAHNVEFQSALQNAAAARDPLQRMLYQREARLLEPLERRLCARASFVFTLAREDSQALGLDERRSAALPLVTGAAPLADAAGDPACEAAMIGTWTWRPNLIGLEWFLDEVTPHLPEAMRIRIAGATPAGLPARHAGVALLGRIDDARALLAGAAMVPLVSRAGTGVQLKTIEAFELGLPCVATSASLRGVAHLPANCVVADDPKEFARAMVEMAAAPRRLADGAAFRTAQLKELDRQVARGLARLSEARRKAAA